MTHTLVLNRNFYAVHIADCRKAVSMVYQDHAEVVDGDDESRLYIGALNKGWDTPLPRLRERASGYALREKRACYLALDDHRLIQFEADGSQRAVDSLPEKSKFAFAPIYEWPEKGRPEC